MKTKIAIFCVFALSAALLAGCGAAGESTSDTAAESSGKQITSAWLQEGDTRANVRVDVSGGWSAEYATGAVYLYDNWENENSESLAMFLSLSKDVYEEYLTTAAEGENYQETDTYVSYTDGNGEGIYLLEAGENTHMYFMLYADPDVDGAAILDRISVEVEESGTPDTNESSLYTTEELDQATAAVTAKFDEWSGCELKTIRYAGDENSTQENIDWLNGLNGGGHNYTQCAQFLMDFHSPVDEADLKETAWEPDTDYNDYQWWVARTDGGDWEVVSWGY